MWDCLLSRALWSHRETSSPENARVGHTCLVSCCVPPMGSHRVMAQSLHRVWWEPQGTHSSLQVLPLELGVEFLSHGRVPGGTMFPLWDVNSTCALGAFPQNLKPAPPTSISTQHFGTTGQGETAGLPMPRHLTPEALGNFELAQVRV